MNNPSKFAWFILGAATGSAATWFLVKDRYAKIAQDEIDSVKAVYTYDKHASAADIDLSFMNAQYTPDDDSTQDDRVRPSPLSIKPELSEYVKIIKQGNYVDYSKTRNDDTASVDGVAPMIRYVIPPESFGEIDDYDQICLSYFDDGYLTDEDYSIVQNIDEKIGVDSLNTFGQYEEETVYVQNDELRCYYQIDMDAREYTKLPEEIKRVSNYDLPDDANIKPHQI